VTDSETDRGLGGTPARVGESASGRVRGGRTLPRLHLVTDDAILRREDFVAVAHAAVAVGGEDLALHLRGPATDGRTVYRRTVELRDAARASGSLLVVNDRVDVALAAGADGVQLGGRSLDPADLPGEAAGLAVGVSVHSADAARSAGSVDWLLVGTIYPTASHPGRPGSGPGLVGAVTAVTSVPAVAIGGVTPERTTEVMRSGAWGVAIVRGVWDAEDPIEALHRYLEVAAPDTTPDSTPNP